MMIFTYLKIAGVLAIAAVIGFYVWNYHHRGAVIEALKIEKGNLEVQKNVSAEVKNTETKVVTRTVYINRGEIASEKAIDETLNSRDVERIINLWNPYELHPDAGLHPAPNGRGGSSGPAP